VGRLKVNHCYNFAYGERLGNRGCRHLHVFVSHFKSCITLKQIFKGEIARGRGTCLYIGAVGKHHIFILKDLYNSNA